MVKTSNVALIALIAFIVGFILGAVAIRKYRPCINLPVVSDIRDTIIIRDTIPGEVPEPKKVEVIRYDTVRLEINGDSVAVDTLTADTTRKASDAPRAGQNGEVLIPVSRKVYQTSDYRAVVSGWRPSLDSIQLYRQTTTVTQTVTKIKNPRWSLSAGVGLGYAVQKVVPYAGVTFGLVLWSK